MKINVLILNYIKLIFDKVHVKGRSLIINCGDGAQKVRFFYNFVALFNKSRKIKPYQN